MSNRATDRNWTIIAGLTALQLVLVTGACDILDVDLPGRVEEETLNNPKQASLLVNSAIADFECAFNNFTFGASAQSDETWHTSGGQVNREWGLRIINNNQQNFAFAACEDFGFGQYTVQQTARKMGEMAVSRLEEWTDEEVPGNRQKLLATAEAYTGYDYVMLGEPYCSMAIEGGPEISPAQVLQQAEEHFSRAIDVGQQAGASEIVNLARVGRARVRLDLGDFEGAVDDAEEVPVGYVRYATRSSNTQRRWNKGAWQYLRSEEFTIPPDMRNLDWKGVEDPRTAVEFNRGLEAYQNVHTGENIEHWFAKKHENLDSNIELATWEEAQLIIAEAAAHTGNESRAVDIINTLHDRAGLPPFDPSSDQVEGPTNNNVLNMVLEERKRELFMEGGHRLNDMLRYDIPFFLGISHLGREYGTTTCWPLPDVERRGNPNID